VKKYNQIRKQYGQVKANQYLESAIEKRIVDTISKYK
jgi:hypothetical protein